MIRGAFKIVNCIFEAPRHMQQLTQAEQRARVGGIPLQRRAIRFFSARKILLRSILRGLIEQCL